MMNADTLRRGVVAHWTALDWMLLAIILLCIAGRILRWSEIGFTYDVGAGLAGWITALFTFLDAMAEKGLVDYQQRVIRYLARGAP